MTSKIAAGVFIHLIVPLAGIGLFLMLCLRMSRSQIPHLPYRALLLLFGCYGWLLIACLYFLLKFDGWSGMHSLLFGSAILFSPIICLVIAFRGYPKRARSSYHAATFWSALVYPGAMLLSWYVFVGR